MEINRDLYLSKLIQSKENGLIKVVTGLRRSGKSYLLKTLFKNHLLNEGVAADHIAFGAGDLPWRHRQCAGTSEHSHVQAAQ